MQASNQTENFYVIEDVPSLQLLFTASMPSNLLKKLDKRSIENKSKLDTFEKLAKAENFRKEKAHELLEKAQQVEEHQKKALDFKNKGPMFQQEQQNKVNALEQKLNKAAEQASEQLILRIQKAAQHNEKVRINKNENLLKQLAEVKDQSLHQVHQRQEKAQSRRNRVLEQKVQNALDSQNKFKFDVEVHQQRELEQKKNQIVDKQQKAEQKRQQLIEVKLQKAKDSQSKFNRNFRSVSNQRVNLRDIIEPHQVVRNQSVSQVKQSENKQMQNDSQNVNVSLPINFKIEPHNNLQKETQQINMNQQKVMYVGGNKITFNVYIDIKVELIDS